MGKRHGKGTTFVYVPYKTAGGVTQICYRFTGLFVHDTPVWGEFAPVDTLPDGIDTTSYYLGNCTPIGGTSFLDTPIYELSALELFAALAIYYRLHDASPAMIMHCCGQDYKLATKNSEPIIAALKTLLPQMNDLIGEARASSNGFCDEDLTEYEVFILSRVLRGVRRIPTVKALLNEKDRGDPGLSVGLKIEDYKLRQSVQDESIGMSLDDEARMRAIYRAWYKYECINGADATDGFAYSVDNEKETEQDSMYAALTNLQLLQKPLAHEDCRMLMELAKRRRVYKWRVDKTLEMVQPEVEIGAFTKVSGPIHAEQHEEPKEFFRSMSRKFTAIQDNASGDYAAFAEKVDKTLGKPAREAMTEVLENLPDKDFVDYKQDPTRQVKVEATPRPNSGRKKRYKMEVAKKKLLNTMGRLKDAEGIAGVETPQDVELELYQYRDDKFISANNVLSSDLKQPKVCCGFVSIKTKDGLLMRVPLQQGQATTGDATIHTTEFAYDGKYKNGSFDGDETHFEQYSAQGAKQGLFGGVSNYAGGWREGLFHGKNCELMMYVDGGAKAYEVKADFDQGKITALHKGKCTGTKEDGKGPDSWAVPDGKTLEFWLYGTKVQTPKPKDFGSKERHLFVGTIPMKAAKDEKDAASVKIENVSAAKSGKLTGSKCTIELPNWGSFHGDLTEGKRKGPGSYTYPKETFMGNSAAGADYGGTTIQCDSWKDDKLSGLEVKVQVRKNGVEQAWRTLKLDPNTGKLKQGGGCCAAPLPTELITGVPPTVELPGASEGGIPLPFSKKVERKPVEVTAPWDGKIKF